MNKRGFEDMTLGLIIIIVLLVLVASVFLLRMSGAISSTKILP